MPWLKNCWYVGAWSDELAGNERLARTILDEPVLLWRDGSGKVLALLDRCPHRLAPLSLGSIHGNVVRCGYHGLAFDGSTGNCVDNPHGPITNALRSNAFPVVERHNIIWLWMGDAASCNEDEIPDLSFIDRTPPTAFSKGYTFTAADHRLLEDNTLDLSHSDYLHPDTLGGGSFTRSKPSVEERDNQLLVRWITKNEKALPIWKPEMPDPDALTDMKTEVVWRPSGVMTLDTWTALAGGSLAEGLTTRNAHLITPETATSSHYFYCNSRNYRVDDAEYNSLLSVGLDQAFAGEDKPMIEAQQIRLGTRDLLDCSPSLLSIDNASTRARRIYAKLLRGELEREDQSTAAMRVAD